MSKNKFSPAKEAPDQRKLSSLQIKRLLDHADIEKKEIAGLTIAEAAERLKWRIDPAKFLFRKICGKVVKKDPATGEEYPVPFATVHVEDTDCHLISYFPKPWPWGWFFPFHCHRETIATTKTDKCGNFCVLVPRFDIDHILKWRHERVCFPIIFRRPDLSDLLDRLDPEVIGPWPPIPGPDPGPLDILTRLPSSMIEAIGGKTAHKLVQQVTHLQTNQTFGGPNRVSDDLMHARVFETELPPPLPNEFHRALAGQGKVVAAKGASAMEGVRAAIALKLGLEPAAKEIADFSPQRFIGPFLRCRDFHVPEWHTILDVPDITFRVTQDTNGDGVEENIYSEGHFDVRWDADPLPQVKLIASSTAKESRLCDAPTVPCSNVPALVLAGLMPLANPDYFDNINGFAVRPNRPSLDGATPVATDLTRPAAQTPFCGYLNLFGCVNVAGAKFYRVLQSTDDGATFSAITGLSWNLYKTDGNPFPVTADSSGWYSVLPDLPVGDPDALWPDRLVLSWPTPPLGKIILKVETANAGKSHLAYSSPVTIQGDNTVPSVLFTRMAWKFKGENDSALRSLLGMVCPTIHRGAAPKDIEVVFEVSVNANHLRNAGIWPSGCGGGSFSLLSGNTSHWHTSGSDNSAYFSARYSLNGADPLSGTEAMEGAYSFHGLAYSRAINPNGQHGENNIPPDWYVDDNAIYTHLSLAIAVVNSN